jgi:hypothetical protein
MKTFYQQFAFYFPSLSPASTYLPHSQSQQSYSVVNKVSTNGVPGGDCPHEYEQLTSLQPSRPAPKPPGSGTFGTYSTIAAYSGKFFLSWPK